MARKWCTSSSSEVAPVRSISAARSPRLGANASYRPFQMVVGDGIVRNDLAVTFRGQHSTFDLGSAKLVGGHGHADTTLVVDHAVPHCASRELVQDRAGGRRRAPCSRAR